MPEGADTFKEATKNSLLQKSKSNEISKRDLSVSVGNKKKMDWKKVFGTMQETNTLKWQQLKCHLCKKKKKKKTQKPELKRSQINPSQRVSHK